MDIVEEDEFEDSEFEDDDSYFSDHDYVAEAGLDILQPSQSSNIRLDPEAIAAMRTNEVARVSGVLCLDPGVTCQLLNHCMWNGQLLIEKYLEDPDDVLRSAGLEALVGNAEKAAPLDPIQEYDCGVCFSAHPAAQVTRLACQHVFCNDCWRSYLAMQVADGNSIGIECMEYKCTMLIDEVTMRSLVPDDVYKRFAMFIEAAYVDTNPLIKWCPAPGCGNAVRCALAGSRDVRCSCGFKFCFQCNEEAHFPASCSEMVEWQAKCKDDSETFNWLKSNTQDCPRCHTAIEKNGGCSHMTCRKPGCGYEFCWVCLGDYRTHTSCNRYNPDKLREQSDARSSLERYLHYYNRYVRHEQSKQFEEEMRRKAKRSMESLTSTSERWMDSQFILVATETLIECRRTLKYTYVRGYYMQPGPEKNLYEFLQEDLEATTDHLAEELERDPTHYSRRIIIDMANLARRRLENLLKGVEEGLTTGEGASGL